LIRRQHASVKSSIAPFFGSTSEETGSLCTGPNEGSGVVASQREPFSLSIQRGVNMVIHNDSWLQIDPAAAHIHQIKHSTFLQIHNGRILFLLFSFETNSDLCMKRTYSIRNNFSKCMPLMKLFFLTFETIPNKIGGVPRKSDG
jgi:hypothetical protein